MVDVLMTSTTTYRGRIMLNLDLEAAIARAQRAELIIPIKLEDEMLFPDGGPTLLFKLDFPNFRRMHTQMYTPKMKSKKKGFEFDMESISGKDYDFGLKMAEYVCGWEGISTPFSNEKLIEFFKSFPTVCEAFGSNLNEAYKAKDAFYMKDRKDAEKN